MVQAVIFDIDGTLVDSVDEHAEAWRRAFLEFGVDVPFAHVRSQIGKGSDQLMPVFLSDEDLERSGKELSEFRTKLFVDKFLPKVRPLPRVRDLFQALRARGVRVALATSAKGEEMQHYVKLVGIDGLYDVATNADEVDASKPAPDIFAAAWEKLGKPALADCVAVGDTPYDALAATKLSLPCVGVRTGGFPDADLRTAGCRALYDGPAQLLEQLERDPQRWPWVDGVTVKEEGR